MEPVDNSLSPTFKGYYIATMADADLLVERCVRGLINPFPRRLTPSERDELVQSGNVFIYKETLGMVRWTDGKKWSPSRKYGDFFVYKEEVPSPKSKKTQQRVPGISKPKLHGRVLAGPLVDDGSHPRLVKKSVSVTKQSGLIKSRFHLVSYYSLEDVNKLPKPSETTFYQHPRSDIDGPACNNRVFNPSNNVYFPPSASAAGSHYPPPSHEHDTRLPIGLSTTQVGPLPANGNWDFSNFQHPRFDSAYQIGQYNSRVWPFHETR